MAKRLTDVNKWDKLWFRKLNPTQKCFWMYLVDRCNYAGIWEVDFEIAQIYVGEALANDEIREIFKDQYVELGNGSKWFIKDFIRFQYGTLTDSNKMYRSVISVLDSEHFDYTPFMGHISPIDGGKDKDTVKDMVKDKVTVKVKDKERIVKENKEYAEFVHMTEVEHKTLVDKFGKEITEKAIEILDNGKGSKGYKYKSDYRAILSWAIDKAKEDLGKTKKTSNTIQPEPNKYKNDVEGV